MYDESNPVVGQAKEELETADHFRAILRSSARRALLALVEEEVEALCGPRHFPSEESSHYRSGGVNSPVYLNGQRDTLRRPRVRRTSVSGGSEEASLKTWALAQDPGEWEQAMMRAVLCGVSTRKVSQMRESEVRGESRSSLSRLWQRKAAELVDQLQESPLSEFDLVVLMVDAVVLCRDLVATVALGVDRGGNKRVLGFRVGSSESEEVCHDLLSRLSQRGLRVDDERVLLAVLDGSKALENAVTKAYPGVLIQRCLVHKERNIRRYLPYRHWKRLGELFKKLRISQGAASALEAAAALDQFLADKNAQARESYEEAGEGLLRVMRLEIPNTLYVSLLSTNAIENSFKNLRRHIGRVCRWREETKQADLWVASGLGLAEKGFRRIRGHDQMPALIEALVRHKKGLIE